MPKRECEEKLVLKGEKECWHPYSLQALSPKRFRVVVGKILKGHYQLIPPRAGTRV